MSHAGKSGPTPYTLLSIVLGGIACVFLTVVLSMFTSIREALATSLVLLIVGAVAVAAIRSHRETRAFENAWNTKTNHAGDDDDHDEDWASEAAAEHGQCYRWSGRSSEQSESFTSARTKCFI